MSSTSACMTDYTERDVFRITWPLHILGNKW